MFWRVILGCGSLVRFLVTQFVVVILVIGSFLYLDFFGGRWVGVSAFPFYGLLLFPALVSCVLSSSVITESHLLCPFLS